MIDHCCTKTLMFCHATVLATCCVSLLAAQEAGKIKVKATVVANNYQGDDLTALRADAMGRLFAGAG